jgi:PAS domain-containing protein
MCSRQALKPKAAENECQNNEAGPTGVQRPLGVGKWEWNLETKEYSWSEEMYQIFNLPPTPVPLRTGTFLNLVHPDDRQRVAKALGDALVGAQPYNLDHRILRADDSVRLVHGEALVCFNRGGRPVRMTGTLQEVTDMRRGEEAAPK